MAEGVVMKSGSDNESGNVENEENEKTGGNGKNEESENFEAIEEVEIVNIDEPHDIIEIEDPGESMNETFVNPSCSDNDASSKILKCEMFDFKPQQDQI